MKFIFLIVLSIIFLTSCYYDKAQLVYPATGTCDTTNATYSLKVVPIINANCNACHSGAATAGAGIKLDTYAGIKTYVTNGQLLNSINQTGVVPAMPLSAAKLSACEISQITAWINAGALNN
ncbi:MAG TPA: hypothetical protein VHP12_06405 [Chitinophagaceae bacterium]|nr:hypothetical protein [Chitinophagaceae bacterium]